MEFCVVDIIFDTGRLLIGVEEASKMDEMLGGMITLEPHKFPEK